MYVSRKMKPVKTTLGMRGERMKGSDGGGKFNHDIFAIL
jgi:hypothetical protein